MKLKLNIQKFSSTNATTHYELSQYIGSDKPTYLVDYNQDMSKIDTAIYTADSTATQASNNIGTMSNLTTTEKSSLVGAINEIDAQVTTNTNNISTNTSDISTLGTNQGTLANLTTTEKSSLVGAINEVNAKDIGKEVGTIKLFAGDNAPTNYLICDGSAISRETYSTLFSVIGTKYGIGDGATTFNIPDLRGKFVVGLDSNDTDFDNLGETGGEKEHTLTIDEIPSHNHTGTGTLWGQASGYGNINPSSTTAANRAGTVTVASQGGGQAHNNLPPYFALNYIIKIS